MYHWTGGFPPSSAFGIPLPPSKGDGMRVQPSRKANNGNKMDYRIPLIPEFTFSKACFRDAVCAKDLIASLDLRASGPMPFRARFPQTSPKTLGRREDVCPRGKNQPQKAIRARDKAVPGLNQYPITPVSAFWVCFPKNRPKTHHLLRYFLRKAR